MFPKKERNNYVSHMTASQSFLFSLVIALLYKKKKKEKKKKAHTLACLSVVPEFRFGHISKGSQIYWAECK